MKRVWGAGIAVVALGLAFAMLRDPAGQASGASGHPKATDRGAKGLALRDDSQRASPGRIALIEGTPNIEDRERSDDEARSTREERKQYHRKLAAAMREGGTSSVFDWDRLESAGLDDSQSHALREAFEHWQDRAEGFETDGRHPLDWVAATPDLRQRFGDDLYDALAYVTHHRNRVVVGEVMGGPGGAGAGLRSGDVVVSVEGERIFDLQAYKRQVHRGGEAPLKLVFRRDGRLHETWIGANGMGFIPQQVSKPPESSGRP